jgi:integrase/recombinase XerD
MTDHFSKSIQDNPLINEFLMSMFSEKFSSKNTIESYKRDLVKFSSFLVKNLDNNNQNNSNKSFDNSKYPNKDENFCVVQSHLDNLLLNCSHQNIVDFLSHLHDRKNSFATINRSISSIRQFYLFLFREKKIHHNPCVNLESPKIKKTLPKIATEDSMMKLLDFAAQDKSDYGVKVSLILEILYATGIRVSELIKIKTSDFIQSDQDILILVKGKGAKERIVPLNDQVVSVLNNYLDLHRMSLKSKEFIFKNNQNPHIPLKNNQNPHISRQRIGQIIKEIMNKSGLNFEISPHKIRHSFATHMLENNCNLVVVKDLLGHSDISTTQIYTHVVSGKLKEVTQKFHPLSHLNQNNLDGD